MKKHLPIWKSFESLAVVALLLGSCPTVVVGWGTIGHEIVANLAWRQLSNSTKLWVQEILEMNSTFSILTPNADYDDIEDDDDDPTNSPLGLVADWADRVRHFMPWSAPLHYIDIRDDLMSTGNGGGGCHVSPHLNPSCHFVYDRDCVNNTCVAGAILNYTQQLLWVPEESEDSTSTIHLRGGSSSSSSSSSSIRSSIPKKKEALMFLTHFIGDIHQPLHCSRTTDKGGNDFHVHFDLLPPNNNAATTTAKEGRSRGLRYYYERDVNSTTIQHHHGWNLHSVWDTGLIDVALERNYNQSRTLLEEDLWQELQTFVGGGEESQKSSPFSCNIGANQTCTIQWGQESWSLAIRFAYTLEDNATDVKDGATLDESYYETRWPLAKERLVVGAIRLATTLEWIHGQQQHQQTKLVQQKQQPELPEIIAKRDKVTSWSFLEEWLSWNARMMVAARTNY